ncbi:hypothetical protein [Nonomuraea sp. NPDC050786]|uniref:hypothetical protein n=1 Tax=Nonomuraea sp. NPDC050786 TaxID=3154840 RepID=UPI0033C39151
MRRHLERDPGQAGDALGGKEASKPKASRGSPLLEVTRLTYDDTGQPLHLLRRTVNPQRVHIADQRLPITSP